MISTTSKLRSMHMLAVQLRWLVPGGIGSEQVQGHSRWDVCRGEIPGRHPSVNNWITCCSVPAQAKAWTEEVQEGLLLQWVRKQLDSAGQEQCAPAVRPLKQGVASVSVVVCLQDAHIVVPYLSKLVRLQDAHIVVSCLSKLVSFTARHGDVKLKELEHSAVPPGGYSSEKNASQVGQNQDVQVPLARLGPRKFQDLWPRRMHHCPCSA
eukprot:1157935-Pelagomonas_calceolata.AAC.8